MRAAGGVEGGTAARARALGYAWSAVRRAEELAGRPLESPDDVRTIVDRFSYDHGWRERYRVRSVAASLASDRITCIDAAILAYGLLEWIGAPRGLLAIHRKHRQTGEECGHVVALHADDGGQVGAISKSSFEGLGHRAPGPGGAAAIAADYARAYVAMDIEPLFFGTTTLEEVAGETDWRHARGDVSELCERIQSSYRWAFERAPVAT